METASNKDFKWLDAYVILYTCGLVYVYFNEPSSNLKCLHNNLIHWKKIFGFYGQYRPNANLYHGLKQKNCFHRNIGRLSIIKQKVNYKHTNGIVYSMNEYVHQKI